VRRVSGCRQDLQNAFCLASLRLVCICCFNSGDEEVDELNVGEMSWREQLNNDKWATLRDVFDGFTDDDIAKFTAEELIDLAEPRLKIRLALFIKSHLGALLSKRQVLEKTENSSVATPDVKARFGSNGTTVVVEVISTRFKNVSDSPTSDCLDSWARSLSQKERDSVKILDLSRNSLLDDDVPFVLPITSQFQNLILLDLSVNRIAGKSGVDIDSALIAILTDKAKRWQLNLSSNPIATIERKDFFAALESRQDWDVAFSRLIWIPEGYVQAANWKILLSSNDVKDLIFKTHDRFYKK